MNIFTDVAVNTGNHGDILIGLKKIIVQIDLLITGVQGYGQVDLDVSAFARTVFDLVQVRRCFYFLIFTFFYSMRYSLGYRENFNCCGRH